MARKLLRPSVIVPTVLSVGLIVALLAFANTTTVVTLVTHFPHGNLLWFLLITAIYEVVRGAQWTFLLHELRIPAPLRAQIFVFVINEFSRNLPVGSYFQNYLLEQSTGADFARTSAATTVILVSEVVECLLGVLILGLGAWTMPVRAVILSGAVVCLLLVWAYMRLHQSSWLPRWIREQRRLRGLVTALRRFREASADLLHPRTLIIQGLLGAAYLLLASAGLYVVTRGLAPHDTAIGFPQALAVYLFTLASAALIPLPEAGGVGAFLAFGVSRSVAVAAMLLNRVLSIICSMAGAALIMIVLPGELRAILQARGHKQAAEAQAGTSGHWSGKQC